MEKVGKYKIVETLLNTSFSDIYIAEDPDLDITVAVKIFHPKGKNVGEEAQYGPDFWRERFIEEARILGRLDHPNIVKAFYMDYLDDGEPYFVMPFLVANLLYEIGEDEDDPEEIKEIPKKWRPRALSPRRAVEIWRQMLDALAYMHERDLVHRDIKPQNVLLTSKNRGRVKLCDFGMVKVPDAKGSRSGIWIGTLDYISPEQHRSAADVDVRSDVFSAGAVMYRMLTGRLPNDNRAPLRAGRLGVPQELCNLIDDCMRRKVRLRPQNAGEALQRLNEIVPDINMILDKTKIPRRAAAIKVITKKPH